MNALHAMQERAHGGLQATVRAMNDRVDIPSLQEKAGQTWHEAVDLVRKRFAELTHAVNVRLGIVKEGKKILDEGGLTAEQVLIAKKASLDVASGDQHLVESVRATVDALEDAAAKLRQAHAAPAVRGITGRDEFSQLVEAYEARAKLYKQVALLLEQPTVPATALTPAEADALKLTQVKEGVRHLRAKAAEGLDTTAHLAADSTAHVRRRAANACC